MEIHYIPLYTNLSITAAKPGAGPRGAAERGTGRGLAGGEAGRREAAEPGAAEHGTGAGRG
jgi:hypothetical protein